MIVIRNPEKVIIRIDLPDVGNTSAGPTIGFDEPPKQPSTTIVGYNPLVLTMLTVSIIITSIYGAV